MRRKRTYNRVASKIPELICFLKARDFLRVEALGGVRLRAEGELFSRVEEASFACIFNAEKNDVGGLRKCISHCY